MVGKAGVPVLTMHIIDIIKISVGLRLGCCYSSSSLGSIAGGGVIISLFPPP